MLLPELTSAVDTTHLNTVNSRMARRLIARGADRAPAVNSATDGVTTLSGDA